MKPHGTFRNKLQGEWRYDLWNPDGSLALSSEWGDNVITDYGIVAIATDAAPTQYGIIGSNPTPPVENISSIGTFLAGTALANGNAVNAANPSSPYDASTTKSWRFLAGEGTGFVREMGAGTEISGALLFSHHAVSPEFEKLSNQVLDVFYRLTFFPELGDLAGSGVVGDETYNTIVRGLRYGQGMDTHDQMRVETLGALRCYDGLLAAVTANTPLGNSSGNPVNFLDNLGAGAIANGGFREIRVNCGLDVGNVAAGVRCVDFSMLNGQHGQCEFKADGNGTLALDARIPKDNTKEMTLSFRYEWTRK